MDRYTVAKQINAGAFGSVFEAIDKKTDRKVAVKKVYKKFYEFNLKQRNREVKALKALNHENLITLLDFVVKGSSLYFIFEYMDMNLFEVLQSRSGAYLPKSSICCILSQVLSGLTYMHSVGLFHRDLKPENILVSGRKVKVADFGLVREVDTGGRKLTPYVSTRWYRAPEVILSYKNYSTPIDLWALGCITVELMTGVPLFPGDHDLDMLHRITTALGSPNDQSSYGGLWVLGVQLAAVSGYRFARFSMGNLLERMVGYPSLDDPCLDFVTRLLQFDPNRRLTAKLASTHPFLNYTLNHRLSQSRVERPNFTDRKDIFDDFGLVPGWGPYNCTNPGPFHLSLGTQLERSTSLALECPNFPTPKLELKLRPSTGYSSTSSCSYRSNPICLSQPYLDPPNLDPNGNLNLGNLLLEDQVHANRCSPFEPTQVHHKGNLPRSTRLSLYDALQRDQQIYLTLPNCTLSPKARHLHPNFNPTHLRRKSNLVSDDFCLARKLLVQPNPGVEPTVKPQGNPIPLRQRTRPITCTSPTSTPYRVRRSSVESNPEPLARELLSFMTRTLDNVVTDSALSKLSQGWNLPTLTHTLAKPSLVHHDLHLESVPVSIVNSCSSNDHPSETDSPNGRATGTSPPTLSHFNSNSNPSNRHQKSNSYATMDPNLNLPDLNQSKSYPTSNPHHRFDRGKLNSSVIVATATTLNMVQPKVPLQPVATTLLNDHFPTTSHPTNPPSNLTKLELNSDHPSNHRAHQRRSSLGNLFFKVKRTLFQNPNLSLTCSPNHLKNQFSMESIYQPPNLNCTRHPPPHLQLHDGSLTNNTLYRIGPLDFEL